MKLSILVIALFCSSCVSVPYLKQHQYQGNVKELTELVYDIGHGKKILLEKRHFIFTKNGRVKYEQRFDGNNNILVTKEKKLWFVKQSFPDKESYYCKTRWKTHNRERISCYTQKQYKQNQSIVYYNDDGSIAKKEEDFSTFTTQYYHYNTKNELTAISIRDKQDKLIDSIVVRCAEKDQYNNCTSLEKRYTVSDSMMLINRFIKY